MLASKKVGQTDDLLAVLREIVSAYQRVDQRVDV